VVLGDHTVVGANSVVTKSFPQGHVVLGGVPAKVLAGIEPEKCINYRNDYEYIGFVPKRDFDRDPGRFVDV